MFLVAIPTGAFAAARTETFTLKASHGKERAGEKVRLPVPADYRHPGRTFEIAFYRLPATKLTGNPPVVFLMGGPGIPASVTERLLTPGQF